MTQPEPRTTRARRRFAATQTVHARPEEVFPLLCPVREHHWIPSWECEIVYTASGVAEEGCVFTTEQPAEGGVDTWVVTRYEPPRRIAFVRVDRLRTMLYDIRLEQHEDGRTTLAWEQVITALDEEGDHHVAGLAEDDFQQMVAGLERMLAHYLETGEALEGERSAGA